MTGIIRTMTWPCGWILAVVVVAYSNETLDFTFFDAGGKRPARVSMFGLTPDDPALFSWGVRVGSAAVAGVQRITYGVVPEGFVRTTAWYGDPPLKSGAPYRVFVSGLGMSSAWLVPGVTPAGACLPPF